jgi:hypothetical protein
MDEFRFSVPKTATCPGCNSLLTERSMYWILGFAWCGFCPRSERLGFTRCCEWSLWFHLRMRRTVMTHARGLAIFTPAVLLLEPLVLLSNDDLDKLVSMKPCDSPFADGWPP